MNGAPVRSEHTDVGAAALACSNCGTSRFE
jgi:hypothetical protein